MSRFAHLIHDIEESVQPVEFVGGLFPKQHISVIASKAGVGKTWYILKLVKDLSVGGQIFMSQALNEPERKSLLLCGETGISLILDRIQHIEGYSKKENIVIMGLADFQRGKLTSTVDTPEGAKTLWMLCDEIRPDVMILDTLMSFRSDDENTAQNTSEMMGRLQTIAEKLNLAIILTHHLRKSDRKERGQVIDQDEIIGSSALVRRAASAFILVKCESEYALRPVKSWWKEPCTVTYRMMNNKENVLFVPSEASSNKMIIKAKIADYVNSQPPEASFKVSDIAFMFACSSYTAREALREICGEPVNFGVNEKLYSRGLKP